ncbi:MAG: hypothetical protein R2865_05815 [Deinococcales bacterium]
MGFELERLAEVMGYLHQRAVKSYHPFNTLVFDDELSLAEKTLEQIALAGVDAIIVQDISLLQNLLDC